MAPKYPESIQPCVFVLSSLSFRNLSNVLSRSLYQVKMIKFACFGEKSGKKHIFMSDSCQLIVVDLNLRDEPFNVYLGGSTKH